jgi:tetratricopeptide (TPR) repeat protein
LRFAMYETYMRRLGQLLFAGFLLVSAALIVRLRSGSVTVIEPPLPADLTQLDPHLNELVQTAVSRVRRDPQSAEAWRELGMIYHANGLIDLAEASHQHAVAADPRCAQTWYHLAMVQNSLGEVGSALESMQRALACDGTYAPAHWRAGFWQLERSEIDHALDAFIRASELDPTDAAARIGIARVYLQRAEHEKATAILSDLSAQSAGSNIEGYVNQLLSCALQRLGRFEQAQAVIACGTLGAPPPVWNDPWFDELGRYQTGLSAGLQHAQMLASSGELERAAGVLQILRSRRPQDVHVLLMLAACRRDQHRFDECFAILRKALEFNPQSHFVHTNFALAYLTRGAQAGNRQSDLDRELALQHADEALRLNPAFSVAHGARADVMLARGQQESAVQSYLTAAHFDREPAQWLMRAGKVQFDRQQWASARETFKRVTQLAPEHPEGWQLLGRSLARLGDVPAATAALSEADRIQPGDPVTHAALGEVRLIRIKPGPVPAAEPR